MAVGNVNDSSGRSGGAENLNAPAANQAERATFGRLSESYRQHLPDSTTQFFGASENTHTGPVNTPNNVGAVPNLGAQHETIEQRAEVRLRSLIEQGERFIASAQQEIDSGTLERY